MIKIPNVAKGLLHIGIMVQWISSATATKAVTVQSPLAAIHLASE